MKKFIVLLLFISSAYGVITIDIYKKNANALNVAIVSFTGENNILSQIIAQDLSNSGRFNPTFVADENTTDKTFEAVIYGDVKQINGKFEISVFLKDIWTGKILFAKKTTAQTLSRKLAHHLSDKIFFALLGERSAFEAKIAYVEINDNERAKYKLVIIDSDGENKKVIFSSPFPILSPKFSPDNNYIAYTAFSKNRSNVYVQNLYEQDKIWTLPAFDGIASAPSWHPQGKSILLTLSKEGNQDIYLYHLSSKKLERITTHKGIDTEASFSPDGRTIIWTSNRDGSPQIWQKTNGKITKVAIGGSYNTSATFSPDGKYLALIHRESQHYKTALFHLKDKELILLSDSANDEAPSFAPNSTLVAFSDGSNNLNIATVDGFYTLKLHSSNTIIEPTWSHF